MKEKKNQTVVLYLCAAELVGSERVAEGGGVEARVSEANAPSPKDLRDAIRGQIGRVLGSFLAADVEQLRAQVDVLTAEAAQLRAAKTSAEEKLEHIRVALRGDALRDARSGDYYSTRPRVMANALNQIESLLPPVHVGTVGLGTRDADAGERVDALPPGASSETEQTTKEA